MLVSQRQQQQRMGCLADSHVNESHDQTSAESNYQRARIQLNTLTRQQRNTKPTEGPGRVMVFMYLCMVYEVVLTAVARLC